MTVMERQENTRLRKAVKVVSILITMYSYVLLVGLGFAMLLNMWYNAVYAIASNNDEYANAIFTRYKDSKLMAPFRTNSVNNAEINNRFDLSLLPYIIPFTYFTVVAFYVGGILQLKGARFLRRSTNIERTLHKSYRLSSKHLMYQYGALTGEIAMMMVVYNVFSSALPWNGLITIVNGITIITAIRIICILVVMGFRRELCRLNGGDFDKISYKEMEDGQSDDVAIPVNE